MGEAGRTKAPYRRCPRYIGPGWCKALCGGHSSLCGDDAKDEDGLEDGGDDEEDEDGRSKAEEINTVIRVIT